jgi:hypothetical protein
MAGGIASLTVAERVSDHGFDLLDNAVAVARDSFQVVLELAQQGRGVIGSLAAGPAQRRPLGLDSLALAGEVLQPRVQLAAQVREFSDRLFRGHFGFLSFGLLSDWDISDFNAPR